MKKLLTLLGITAFALGAFADAALPSGTSFENHTADVFDFTADEPETPGAKYWVSTASDIEASVVNYEHNEEYAGSCGRPAQFDGNSQTNFLKIESASAPLYRAILPVSGDLYTTASLTNASTNIGSGLYVDTLVQLSVAQGDQDVTDGNVKLAIWAQTGEEDGTPTNFYVHAGYFQDSSTLVTTNYMMTTTQGFNFNEWHRLTVKAIGNIGGNFVGFVVFVDGDMLTRAGNATIGTSPELTAEAQQFAAGLLPSAVGQGAYKNTLSAVGFSGNGSVDDISFTATAPIFAKSDLVFSLTVGEGVTGFTLTDSENNTTSVADVAENDVVNFTIAGFATNVTVSAITYAADYKNATLSDEVQGKVNGLVFTLNDGATAPAATISAVKDNFFVGETGYPTLAAAIAAVSGGSDTIVLNSNYVLKEADYGENGSVVDVTATMTIDLNGYSITTTESDPLFYVDNGAILTIVNSGLTDASISSTSENGVVYVADTESGVVFGQASDTCFVVVDGMVSGTPGLNIVKGKFDEASNSDGNECAIPPEVIDQDSELSDEPVGGYWVVSRKAPVVATYTVTYYTNDVEYATATYTLNDASSLTPSSIADPVVAGYDFDGWYTDKGTWQDEFEFNAAKDSDTDVYAKFVEQVQPETATYSVDHNVTGVATEYTTSAGNANVTWQNFNFRAAVSKADIAALEGAGSDAHGYYFYLTDGDTDVAETDAAVNLDSITVTWGANAGADIDASDTPYLVVTTADDTPVIIGISEAGAAFAANGTSTFSFSDVVLASNAKYRFYFYKNDVSGLSVGATLTGAVSGRVNGRYHNTSSDARADYNDIRCSGGAGYSINCSFGVSSLAVDDAVILETGNDPVSLDSDSDVPVVIDGKVEGGAVEVGSGVSVAGVFTVCGEATTLELTDSLTATAFYFPAAVTVDASELSGLEPTGAESSKTTVLLSGALKYAAEPTVLLPPAAAGMIYHTSITESGISVTVFKGADCVETISGDTNWSDIKPAAWIDSAVGDKPAIAITYNGETPVTLTFDEAVMAGSLTLTGNIVVEASAAATFGTVAAGAGSVVEMANMTITTQSGAGTYRYRSNYPVVVPRDMTYEYVGGATEDSVAEVSGAMECHGTLKTSGYIRLVDFWAASYSTLEVIAGKTFVNSTMQKFLSGTITIRENATMVNEVAADAFNYSGSNSVYVYGTLDMGATRWSIGNSNRIYVYGGSITGSGQPNNGAALDWIESASDGRLNASGTATISAPIKIRSGANVRFDVTGGSVLTISGTTIGVGSASKSSAGKLKFTSNPTYSNITVGNGTLEFDTESDVDQVVTYYDMRSTYDMGYTTNSNWKGTIVIGTIDAGDTATQVALEKIGNQNSYLTLNGISGNAWCAGSNFTVQPAITLAGNVNFQNGGSGSAVTFRKIAAGTGNLSLKTWSGCSGVTYGFTTLDADNYTGTIQLDGSVLTFNVGDILKVGAQPGDKVLPLSVANNANVNLANATLNGAQTGLELKSDGIYVKTPVALITSADGQTVTPYYDSITNAFASVAEGETLTLVGSAVTLSDDVTVSASYRLAGDAEGTTVTGAGKIYLTSTAELTLDATLTSVGNQFCFSSHDAKLTFPTGKSVNVRPYTAGGCQTGTINNGDGTTTYYQYVLLQLQVGASNVTLAYYGSGDPLVTKQVNEGDIIVFTATPAEGYENPVVTVNGTPLAPEDGKYTVVVGTVNVSISATASAASSDTYEVSVETEIGEDGSFTVPEGTTKVKVGDYTLVDGDGISIDGTTVTVLAPEVVEEAEQEAIVIDDDEVTLNVDLVPGLYYGVGVAASLDDGVSRPDTLTQFDGTNEDDILTVAKPEGNKGFFKVFVDIKQ